MSATLNRGQVASGVIESVQNLSRDCSNERYPLDMLVLVAFCSFYQEAEDGLTADWLARQLDAYMAENIIHSASLAAAKSLISADALQIKLPTTVRALQVGLCIANNLASHTTFIDNLLRDGVDNALLIRLDDTHARYCWSEAGAALRRDFIRLRNR